MLWIDGVGGFLFCEGRAVSFGQPGHANVEVPIMADLSSRHATICRDGEHYLLDPLRPCFVDGRPVDRRVRLAKQADVALGADLPTAVGLRFRVPHACGLSARLDLTTGHRLRTHADGIVLLADTCVVGPAAVSHIHAPQSDRTCVLFRQADGSIVFRTTGTYAVDGRRTTDAAPITRSSRITADDFTWQLEPLT